MKQKIFILTFMFGLSSCDNHTTEKAVKNNTADSIKTALLNKQDFDIFIKDKSQYDQTFIEGLADYNEPIKLIDNFIVTGKDTTYFPEDLVLNKPTIFAGIKNNKKYALTVTRSNLTNLIYKFQITNNNKETLDTKSGIAILGSKFFIGPEGDDDIDGSYGSQEYKNNGKDSYLSIRIEIGKADNGMQRAKIYYGFNEKSKKSLGLDECPTLKTE